ncbi:LysE family transporter [uncultured Aquitalea sp.]|uniref:LysE family translocator n=1 Tax=uncultured Aquitalea sp. TaxID=540272 RepID=UPI0025F29BD1|nr:LysE family transporter [uncultured Aquitalea sp.]
MLAAHPVFATGVRWAGAAYLLWLGCCCWRASGDAAHMAPGSGEPFRRSLWITLGNPKAVLFFMVFFPAFLTPASANLGGFLLLGLVFCLINTTYLLLLCRLAGVVGSRLPTGRWLGRVAGGLYLALGIRLLAAE